MVEKNKQVAEKVFAKNANLDVLHFTNDGQAFSKIGPAKVHQLEIGGRVEDIVTINRNVKQEDILAEEKGIAEVMVNEEVNSNHVPDDTFKAKKKNKI
jgi:hypothetical protein